MGGRFLLDTNIVIALFAEDKNVFAKLKKAQEVYLSSVAIGELYYGAYHSTKKDENLRKIDAFKAEVAILSCDEFSAQFYGQVKSQLRRKGTPIPENDVWIAAIALQYGLTLVSRDSHFEYIEGLSLEKW